MIGGNPAKAMIGAVDQADGEAGCRAGENDERQRQARGEAEIGDEAAQREHRPDREIDAAGHDHEGRAGRHDADQRHLADDADQIVGLEEGRLRDAQRR